MKLQSILDQLNSFEKNSFLKIIDSLKSDETKNSKQIENILSDTRGDLKAMDSVNISKVFNLLSNEFSNYLEQEFLSSTSQIDILTDIIIRDGNCIMKQDWLSRLYESELKLLKKRIKTFQTEVSNEKSSIDELRRRDYQIFHACTKTAYENDELNNQEKKITFDEQTILNTLAEKLELSNEEIKLIAYTVIPLKHLDIDTVINELKNLGVIFYAKKSNIIYVADEMVFLLRRLKGKSVADKFFRRVLRQLKDSQINLICRKHNIDRKLDSEEKIREIINEGISFKGVLSNDIFKEDQKLTDRKKFVSELAEKKLRISPALKGGTLEDKIDNLIKYFDEIERDEKVGISVNGYERLLVDLSNYLPKSNELLKKEFELQDENVLRSSYLLDFNIKPRDVLELIPESNLEKFCTSLDIKTRGDVVNNILENYKDAENLFLENYSKVGFRDLAGLKENGINVKESELGTLFEELTKKIFLGLGFTVDEDLRKQLNTSKDKIDILLKTEDNHIFLVECKSIKESGYNKFSSVSRQLKSYMKLLEKNSLVVTKSLLIAPEFSDDFIKDCGLDYELNLSLISSESLITMLKAFKESKLKKFPHNLLMRDVLIQEDRVIKAIGK
jgi:hypothetical protein